VSAPLDPDATHMKARAEMPAIDAPVVEKPPSIDPPLARLPDISRRQLLRMAALAAPCLVGAGAVFEWLTSATASAQPLDPIVASYDASAHRWGFVVDVGSCIGCGKCVVACKTENNVPTQAEHTRTWIERRSTTVTNRVVVDSPEAGAVGFNEPPPGDATVLNGQFVARLCMQCENSPCTQVCPVGATYRTADGVILVDETRCIGCGYCVVACPYGARYLVPAGANTPTGVAGVADKCTFCYHRITRAQQPACVTVCPVGARKFGDLDDPRSEVSVILTEQPSRVLRPDLGTKPRVHYVGLRDELAI
jgi:Fe-S-cluster-containing dehydrogenase component